MIIRRIATLALMAAVLTAGTSFAQGAKEVPGHSPILPIENEPAPKLIVDPPLPGPLARGAVLISYRTENFRIVPVLGAPARDVSPRVGHLHVTVDDLPWHWGDFSNTNTIVVVGMPPGQHTLLVELSDPEHRILAAQTVTFTVPNPT